MSYRFDAAPNSRLFILAGKGVNEEQFRAEFEKYGKIEDFWIVKDRRTQEDKGVVYITYSKTSEAAHALEEMNGRVIKGNPKPMKVMVANTKRDGSVRDPYEEEKILRLFVIIPKTFTEDDLKKEFSKFGDVDNVSVLRDHETLKSKGFGFVKFHRAYHAALAFENCDRAYKPKFAEPKKKNSDSESRYLRDDYRDSRDRDRDRYSRSGAPGGYPYGDRDRDRDRGMKRGFDDYGSKDDSRRDRREDFIADDGRSMYTAGGTPMDMLQNYSNTGCQRLHITAPLGLTQSYITKLFNLIPGLEYCDLNEQTGVAYARYSTPQCTAYAKDKLDQFEYPIGSRLTVRFADSLTTRSENSSQPLLGMAPSGYGGGMMDSRGPMEPRSLMDTRGPMDMDTMSDNSRQQASMGFDRSDLNPNQFLGSSGGMDRAMDSGMDLDIDRGGDRGMYSDNGTERVTYCNIPLPLPKQLVPESTPLAQRLFIVCQPAAVPDRILRDAFSRFGNLIDVYLLGGRNFGYAKYATKESAARAIRVLHGQSLAGQRLKVLEAEPPKDDEGSKRQKTER